MVIYFEGARSTFGINLRDQGLDTANKAEKVKFSRDQGKTLPPRILSEFRSCLKDSYFNKHRRNMVIESCEMYLPLYSLNDRNPSLSVSTNSMNSCKRLRNVSRKM